MNKHWDHFVPWHVKHKGISELDGFPLARREEPAITGHMTAICQTDEAGQTMLQSVKKYFREKFPKMQQSTPQFE